MLGVPQGRDCVSGQRFPAEGVGGMDFQEFCGLEKAGRVWVPFGGWGKILGLPVERGYALLPGWHAGKEL